MENLPQNILKILNQDEHQAVSEQQMELVPVPWPGQSSMWHVVIPTRHHTVIQTQTHQEYNAMALLNQAVEGFCPHVIYFDEGHNLALVEDLSQHSSFEQELVESKADTSGNMALVKALSALHANTKGAHATELQETFKTHKDFISTVLFDQYLNTSIQEDETLPQKLRTALSGLHQTYHGITTAMQTLKQLHHDSSECVVHGNINPSNVVFKESYPKVVGCGNVHVGPASLDVGSLLAHYILWYHQHMLTPENNDAHRQVSYTLLKLASQTVAQYCTEKSLSGNTLQTFMTETAGFAGCEIIRRVLEKECRLSVSTRCEGLSSAARLLMAYHRIFTIDQLLNIALMLTC